MHWYDVNFDHKVITAPLTKNGEMRYVSLNSNLSQALRSWKKKPNSGDAIFPVTEIKRAWLACPI